MGVLPNVFVSFLFILQLHLISSAPIGQKAPSTDIRSFYPIDSLVGNLPANDDVDDMLDFDDVFQLFEDEIKQDAEGKSKDEDIEEEEIVDNEKLLDEKKEDSNDSNDEEMELNDEEMELNDEERKLNDEERKLNDEERELNDEERELNDEEKELNDEERELNDARVGGTKGCYSKTVCVTDRFGEQSCWPEEICSHTG